MSVDISTKTATNDSKEDIIKLYKKRWFILILFALYAFSSTIQYMQYTIVADVIVEYYQVSYDAVNWTMTIYYVTYVILFVPGSYLLDKLSTRNSVLLGAIGTTAGAWIKVFSVHPDRYWVALLGQGVVSVFQLFILPIPPKLAAVWFGAREVSTACSIGVVGTAMGTSLGFFVPTQLITKDSPESGLFVNILGIAIFCTIITPLLLIFFDDAPPTPPSVARLKIQDKGTNDTRYVQSIKNLLTNKSYALFVFIYAANVSLIAPLMVMINQVTLEYYPNASTDVGLIGLIASTVSVFGALCGGLALDKFHEFRLTTWISHACLVITGILIAATTNQGLWILYIIYSLCGFFTGAVYAVGLEVAVEITYPEPEEITGGIMITFAQLFSIPFILIYSHIFETAGAVSANITVIAMVLAADLLFFVMRFNLRRQAAQNNESAEDIVTKC